MFKDFHKLTRVSMMLMIILPASCADASVAPATRQYVEVATQIEPTATTIVEPTSRATSVSEMLPTPKTTPTTTADAEVTEGSGGIDSLEGNGEVEIGAPVEPIALEEGAALPGYITAQQVLENYPNNALYAQAIERFDNEENSVWISAPNPDGTFTKHKQDKENLQFKEVDGYLTAMTPQGVEIIYRPEVLSWAQKEIETGLATVFLTTNAINSYQDMNVRKDELPNGILPSTIRPRDALELSLLDAEQFEELLNGYRPHVFIGKSPEEAVEKLRGWGSLNPEEITIIPIEQLGALDMKTQFNHQFFLVFGFYYFNTENVSEEQFQAIKDFYAGVATPEQVSLLNTASGGQINENGKLQLSSSDFPWILDKIEVIADNMPVSTAEQKNPNTALGGLKNPIFVKADGTLVIRLIHANMSNIIFDYLLIQTLGNFLNKYNLNDGTFRDWYDHYISIIVKKPSADNDGTFDFFIAQP